MGYSLKELQQRSLEHHSDIDQQGIQGQPEPGTGRLRGGTRQGRQASGDFHQQKRRG